MGYLVYDGHAKSLTDMSVLKLLLIGLRFFLLLRVIYPEPTAIPGSVPKVKRECSNMVLKMKYLRRDKNWQVIARLVTLSNILASENKGDKEK